MWIAELLVSPVELLTLSSLHRNSRFSLLSILWLHSAVVFVLFDSCISRTPVRKCIFFCLVIVLLPPLSLPFSSNSLGFLLVDFILRTAFLSLFVLPPIHLYLISEDRSSRLVCTAGKEHMSRGFVLCFPVLTGSKLKAFSDIMSAFHQILVLYCISSLQPTCSARNYYTDRCGQRRPQAHSDVRSPWHVVGK